MQYDQYDPLSGLPKKTPTKPPVQPTVPKVPVATSGIPAGGPVGGGVAPGDPVYGGPNPIPFQTPVASPQDLSKLLNDHPLYKQAQADIQAARVSDQASRAAARQRALILYGAVPDLDQAAGALGLVGGDIGADVTDTVRQLAAKSTGAGLSTVGRLQRANDDAVKSIRDQLAARGILSSGETGYQLGRQNTALQQSQYDALQQLIDYLAQVQGSYLTNEQGRLGQLGQARTQIGATISPDTAPLDAAAYFGGKPLAPGTSTDYALDALSRFAPSTYDFGAPPTVNYGGGDAASAPASPAAAEPAGPPIGSTDNPAIYRQLGRKMDPRFNY